jgi:dimethylargininase
MIEPNMIIVLTRGVPASISKCELTHLERTPIDIAVARAQHEEYEAALRRLGCVVEHIEPADDFPDSVFVEDTAVVLDEVALITRPGAPSRRGETAGVEAALTRYRPVHRMTAPAAMDGGDVLRVGRALYVGLSSRTNEEGARQLAAAVTPFGYTVECVRVSGCLHLKSAVTEVGDGIVVCNPEWVDPRTFKACEAIAVDVREPFAANVLRIGRSLVCAKAYPRTADALRAHGYDVHFVDASELAKAEAGVTCCSLIIAAS